MNRPLDLMLFVLWLFLCFNQILVLGNELHCRKLGGVQYFGKCYKSMGPTAYTFSDGEELCKTNGFDGLVQIQFQEEEDIILHNIARATGSYWTGVKYWNGQYRYRDGRIASKPSTIDNSEWIHQFYTQSYVRLVYEGSSQWFESLPDSTSRVICEFMYDDYCHDIKGHLLFGKCVRGTGTMDTRNNALNLCTQLGYQSLLTIDSEQEKNLLIEKLSADNIWLDQQNTNNSFIFSNGLTVDYNDHLPVPGNNSFDSVYLSNGKYQVDQSSNDISRNIGCQSVLSPMCSSMHGYYYRGSCYRFYGTPLNFMSAQAFCSSSGYQLAKIQSLDELEFLLVMMTNNSTSDSFVRLDGKYNGTHLLDQNEQILPFFPSKPSGLKPLDSIVVNIANTSSFGQYNKMNMSTPLSFVCQLDLLCFGQKRDAGCGSGGRCVYADSCICKQDIVGKRCQAREKIAFESRLSPLDTNGINDFIVMDSGSAFMTNSTHILSLSMGLFDTNVSTLIGQGTLLESTINLVDVQGIVQTGEATFAAADVGTNSILLFNYANNTETQIATPQLSPLMAVDSTQLYYGSNQHVQAYNLTANFSSLIYPNAACSILGLAHQTRILYFSCGGSKRIFAYYGLDRSVKIPYVEDLESDFKQLSIDPITDSLLAVVGDKIQIISPKMKNRYIGGGLGRFTDQISFSLPSSAFFSPDRSILFTIDRANSQLVRIEMRCEYGYLPPHCLTPVCFGIDANSSTVCSGKGVCAAPDQCVCNYPSINSPDCSQYPTLPKQITTLTTSVMNLKSGLIHPKMNNMLLFCDESDTIKKLNRSSGIVSSYFSPIYCRSMTLTADRSGLIIVTQNFTIELIPDLMNPDEIIILAGEASNSGFQNGHQSKIGVVFNIIVDPVVSRYGYFLDSNGFIRRLDIENKFVETLSTSGSPNYEGHVESLVYNSNTLGYMVRTRDKIVFSNYGTHGLYALDVNTMHVTKIAGTDGPGNNDIPVAADSATSYLDSPLHLSADPVMGDIYVTYRGMGIIKRLSVNGLLTTFAGSYTTMSSNGSNIDNATFAEISSTLFDPVSKSLLIFEKGANQIREIQFTCGSGYIGDSCIPMCYGIGSNSNSVCSQHGQCISPDVCVCNPGFSGSQCSDEYRDLIVETVYNNTIPPCTPMVVFIRPISQSNQTFITQMITWTLQSTILPSAEANQFIGFLSDLHSPNITIPAQYLPMGGQTIIKVTITTNKGITSATLAFNVTTVLTATIDAEENFSIRRADDFVVYSKVLLPKCVSFSRIDFLWEIDSMISGNNPQLLIPKRSLSRGNHLLTLKIFLRNTAYFSSVSTYVTALDSPPIVKIRGGNTAIRIGTHYTLDASDSFYPDDPKAVISFSWFCISQSCSSFVNSGTARQSFTPTIKGSYNLGVEISLNNSVSSTSVTIDVVDEEIPMLSILNNMGRIVSTRKKLALEATVNNNVTSDIIFWWELSEKLANLSLIPVPLSSNNVLTSLSSRFLVLKPGVLKPSKTYQVRINSKKRTSQAVGYSTLILSTSDPPFSPQPSACTVIPDGNKFILLATGWTIDFNYQPLSYSFQYFDDETQLWTIISPFGSANTFSTRLFTQSSSTTQFACYVRNYYEEQTVSYFNSTLKVEGSEDTFNEIMSEQLDSFQNFNGSISRDFGFSLVQMGKLYAQLNFTSNTAINNIISMLSTKKDASSPPEFTIQQMRALSSISQKVSSMQVGHKIDLIQITSSLLSEAQSDQIDSIIDNAGSILSNMLSDTQTDSNGTLNAPIRSVMKDLSIYLLGDAVPGEEARSIQTTAFSISIQRGYSDQFLNSTLNINGTSIYLPLLSQYSQNEDALYAIELISFPDAQSLLWREKENNISSSIISFKLLDSNNSKLAIDTSNDDPLVITIQKFNTTIVDGFRSEYRCYFFDDSADMIWDTRGCWLFNETNTTVTCHCNHTTSFAAFIQYSKEDLLIEEKQLDRTIYFVRISFNILFVIMITLLVIFLIYHRNKQPIRSRIYAPLICLLALFVECTLQGVLRNALLSVRSRENLVYPINIIGGIIITISCPLSIMSLFIYLWQNIRYFMLRKFYELMDTHHAKFTPSRVMLAAKFISSKFSFYISSFIVLLVSVMYFLALSTVGGVESAKSTTASTAITITSSVTYLGVLSIIGLGIIATFLVDAVVWPLRRNLRRSREESSKKNSWSELLSSPLYYHFRKDDPLFFRIDSLCITAAVFVGFVSFGIGISAQYIRMEDDSPLTIIFLLFDLLFTALRILAFGGAISIIRILFILKKKEIKVPERDEKRDENVEDMILSLISSARGLAMFREFCLKEFALENLLCILELNETRFSWSAMNIEQKQSRVDSLFTQYIQPNAAQEVNLPGYIRREVTRLKTNVSALNDQEQGRALIGLHIAIMTNLSDTFSRFITMSEYSEYVKATNIHKQLEDINFSLL